MARRRTFRLFPRYRRPSTGELLGITQAKRRISRRYHLAAIRDPMVGVRNMQRRAKRRVGYYSEPAKFIRHGGCLLPAVLFGLVTLGIGQMLPRSRTAEQSQR